MLLGQAGLVQDLECAVAVFARLERTVPHHVHAARLAKRELGATDGAHLHCAAGGVIDAQRLGELGLSRIAPGVKHI